MYPAAGPRALVLLGRYHAQAGRKRRAYGCFVRAAELARNAAQPYDRLLALEGLAALAAGARAHAELDEAAELRARHSMAPRPPGALSEALR
jgi:hypothetical protein